MCVRALHTHRVSSPTVHVSEEALGLGGRVGVGMMVLKGTSLVSKICIDVYIYVYEEV